MRRLAFIAAASLAFIAIQPTPGAEAAMTKEQEDRYYKAVACKCKCGNQKNKDRQGCGQDPSWEGDPMKGGKYNYNEKATNSWIKCKQKCTDKYGY